MLKLTKYEFRKNLPSIIIVLFIIAAAQMYFTISCLLNQSDHAMIAAVLLATIASIAFFVVIIFGINSYDKELKSKSSYLIFMTPNSSLKIIISKLLYTFLFGTLLVAVFIIFALIDFKLLAILTNNPLDYVDVIKELLTAFGFDYLSIIYSIMGGLFVFLVSLLFIITLSYFSITLASTLLQNKKVKGVVSFVIFMAIFLAVSFISNQLPEIYTLPQTAVQAITTSMPSTLFHFVLMIGCVWGSATLLDKKVSL